MLRERLPQVGERLKAAGEARAGWLGDPTTLDVHSILSRNGEAKICCWLPSEAYAKAWAEYCKTGDVKDAATPPSPMSVKAVAGNGGITLTWQADADFKSGVKGFAVLREGKQVAIVGSPKSNVNPEERFQAWEFGDEPTPKNPAMTHYDPDGKAGSTYEIIQINGVDSESKPSEAVVAN